MITYRLGLYQYEEKIARELVDAIKRNPGCCDTVWLTTMGYYPPLDKHEEYAARWASVLPIYREAGVNIALQISNTMGHAQWEQLDPYKEEVDVFAKGMIVEGDEEPPYLVGPDGKSSYSCFCPRSKKFIEYINSLLTIYASVLLPSRVWFDDDLRAHNHKPVKFSCFCNRCISEFNEIHGTDFTREELVREMNYGDPSVRRKYIDHIRKGIYDFTYGACKAVLRVSPDTAFGLEYEHEHNYLGADDGHILGALHDASGKDVHTRPGGGYYNDKSPFGGYEKTLKLSSANALLPDYVTEYVAEMENLPGAAYGKSIGGIVNEGTVDLAIGCSGLTLTDVQSMHEPMAYYERIFAAIAKARPYWERLSAIAKNNYRSGVVIYRGEAPEMARLTEADEPFCWDKELMDDEIKFLRLGIPITYDKRAPGAYLIHHETVNRLTDGDIEFLLTQPVIADGESVARIIERGYSDRFSLTPLPVDNDKTEYFTSSRINGDKAGMFYGENPYAAGKPMQRYVFESLDDRSEVLGEMHNNYHLSDGKYVGACTLITETKNGGRWAIFGYSIWSDIVNSAKRNQIVGALDAITRMPVRLRSEECAFIIPSVDKDFKVTAVTLSAASQSGADLFEVEVRSPAGENISVVGTRRNDVEFTAERIDNDQILVSVYNLVPYETVTIFFE